MITIVFKKGLNLYKRQEPRLSQHYSKNLDQTRTQLQENLQPSKQMNMSGNQVNPQKSNSSQPTSSTWMPLNAKDASKHPSAYNSELVFIFDWDDTLCPTTSILDHYELPTSIEMDIFQRRITSLLDACLKRGYVFIVTNSKQGWVEEFCQEHMPHLLNYFQANRNCIDIQSTRNSNWRQIERSLWKPRKFVELAKKLVKRFERCKELVVISVGDAPNDKIAAQAAISMLHGGGHNFKWLNMKVEEFSHWSRISAQAPFLERFFEHLPMTFSTLFVKVTQDAQHMFLIKEERNLSEQKP